jgi:hypothetical protein
VADSVCGFQKQTNNDRAPTNKQKLAALVINKEKNGDAPNMWIVNKAREASTPIKITLLQAAFANVLDPREAPRW